ncbi:hypothetical protein BDR26DRAFT_865228, partial [Obelidium mucronatum]
MRDADAEESDVESEAEQDISESNLPPPRNKTEERDDFFYTCFFNEVEREHKPVTSGQRLTLLYSLVQTNKMIAPVAAPGFEAASKQLESLVTEWIASPKGLYPLLPAKLFAQLDNIYTLEKLDYLDSRDGHLLNLLDSVQDENGEPRLVVHHVAMELRTRANVCFAGPDRMRRDMYGMYYDDSDSDMSEEEDDGCICNDCAICYYCQMTGDGDPDCDDWLYEVDPELGDDATYEYKWTSETGSATRFSHVSLNALNEWIGKGSSRKNYGLFALDSEPDERKCLRVTGPFSREVEFIYRNSVLVFWPHEHSLRIGGLDFQLQCLSEMIPLDRANAEKEFEKLIDLIDTDPEVLIPEFIAWDKIKQVETNVEQVLQYCTEFHRLDDVLTLMGCCHFPPTHAENIPVSFWKCISSLKCTKEHFKTFLQLLNPLDCRHKLVPLLFKATELNLKYLPEYIEYLLTERKIEQTDTSDMKQLYKAIVASNSVIAMKALEAKAPLFTLDQLKCLLEGALEASRSGLVPVTHLKWVLAALCSKPDKLQLDDGLMNKMYGLIFQQEWMEELICFEGAVPAAALFKNLGFMKYNPTWILPKSNIWIPHLQRLLNKSTLQELTVVGSENLLWFGVQFPQLNDVGRRFIHVGLTLHVGVIVPNSHQAKLMEQGHAVVVESAWEVETKLFEANVAGIDPVFMMASLARLLEKPALVANIQTWKSHILRFASGLKAIDMARIGSDRLVQMGLRFVELKLDSVARPFVKAGLSCAATVQSLTNVHQLVVERGWSDEIQMFETRIARAEPKLVFACIQGLIKSPKIMSNLDCVKTHVIRLSNGFKKEELMKVAAVDLYAMVQCFLNLNLIELARVYVRTILGKPIEAIGDSFSLIHTLALEKTWLDELRMVEIRLKEESAVKLAARLMLLFKHAMFHTSLQFRSHCERLMDVFVGKDLGCFNASKETAKDFAKFYSTLLRYSFMESLERVGKRAGELSVATLVVAVYDSLKFLMKLLKVQASGEEVSGKDLLAVENSGNLQSTVYELCLQLFTRKPINQQNEFFATFPCMEFICEKTCFMDEERTEALKKAFVKTVAELDAAPPPAGEQGDFLHNVIARINSLSPVLKKELYRKPFLYLIQKRMSQVEAFLHVSPGTQTSWIQPMANLTLCKIDWKDQIAAFLKSSGLHEFRLRAQFGSIQAATGYADKFNKYVAKKEFGVFAQARVQTLQGSSTVGVVIQKDKKYH